MNNELPDTPEYRRLFQATGDRLSRLAQKLSNDLEAEDISSMFVAIAVAGWSRIMPPGDVALRLRDIADSIDTGRKH